MALRVLLVNEPLTYREAIAEALRAHKPLAEVHTADPGALDRAVAEHSPHVVVCSRVVPAVEASILAWVELYTGHLSLSTVKTGEGSRTVDGMDLAGLLGVLEGAERLLDGA